MPKSRGRRPRKSQIKRPVPPREHARALQNFPIVRAVDAAETAGDYLRALDLIEADVMSRPVTEAFWHPERVLRLIEFATYNSVLPGWATSRWVLAQAVRWMDASQRRRFSRAFDRTVQIAGGLERYEGVDEIDSRCKLMDYDWVYRQLVLYEFGGLQHFLRNAASPALIDRADSIRAWAAAPMGAFRYVEEQSQVMRWFDLVGRREVETANIGSASCLWTDAHAIGRLVPTEHGPMFESAPIFVPTDVASWVAEAPEEWTTALQRGCQREAPLELCIRTRTTGFPLLHDVPMWLRQDLALVDTDVECSLHVEEAIAAEVAVVREAMQEDSDLCDESFDGWPVIGAMLLDPAIMAELARDRDPQHAAGFLRLAEQLASPAAEVCGALAKACLDAA